MEEDSPKNIYIFLQKIRKKGREESKYKKKPKENQLMKKITYKLKQNNNKKKLAGPRVSKETEGQRGQCTSGDFFLPHPDWSGCCGRLALSVPDPANVKALTQVSLRVR